MYKRQIEYRNGYDCDVCVNAIVGEDYKYVIYETGEEEYTDLAQEMCIRDRGRVCAGLCQK